MRAPTPHLEGPYLHAVAGHDLKWIDEHNVTRMKTIDYNDTISCLEISVRRTGVEVLKTIVAEALVRNDGDAWLKVLIVGECKIDVPVLESNRTPTEEEERGEEWPIEWIRTDQISLWHQEQRLLAR